MADAFEPAVTIDVGPVTVGTPEPRQQTPLEKALEAACVFARWHGIDRTLSPRDFGIQRSEAGITHATYVDSDVVVVVVLDRNGRATFGLADLDWLHWPATANGTEPCSAECVARRPETVAYLPGDGPVEELTR